MIYRCLRRDRQPPLGTSMSTGERLNVSFRERLRASADALREVSETDPWEPTLRRLKGRVGQDGIERISTHDIFDILEVPMRHRPTQTIRLSSVMRRLGWSNIRARGLN